MLLVGQGPEWSQVRNKNGGERGIRTLGAALNDTHDFQSCSFSQLGHLSTFYTYPHLGAGVGRRPLYESSGRKNQAKYNLFPGRCT